MSDIIFNSDGSGDRRRGCLYDGGVLVYSATPATLALCQYARDLLVEKFHPLDPRTAQDHLTVDEYVAILRRVKPEFINSDRSKELLQDLLAEFACDPEKVYFDVPRLRTSTHSNYLTSGMAYAYHPHRDTWFSAPQCQINWWLPVYEPTVENCLAIHTEYFAKEIENSSACFDYDDWVNNGRRSAHQHVNKDERVQPHAAEPLDLRDPLRVVSEVGGLQLFSAAQLHSSVPNTSRETRLSIDFRTVHLDDVVQRRGAANIDSHCTGTNLGDFLRVSDLKNIDSGVIDDFVSAPSA